MKKTNLYYRSTFARKSAAREWTMLAFVFLLSGPRLLLEVFIRKNFGERYFSIISAAFVTLFLFFIPITIDKVASFYHGSEDTSTIIFKNITWYLFLTAFMYCCVQRQKEIEREPGVYDFAKFSLYNGDIHPRFYTFKLKGKETNRRVISTVFEPALFLVLGILFTILLQKLGILLILCSLCYALGYVAEYNQGDHFIMDTIDNMIFNEELADSFLNGKEPKETRGFDFKGPIPPDEEFRRKVYDNFFEDEEASEAY